MEAKTFYNLNAIFIWPRLSRPPRLQPPLCDIQVQTAFTARAYYTVELHAPKTSHSVLQNWLLNPLPFNPLLYPLDPLPEPLERHLGAPSPLGFICYFHLGGLPASPFQPLHCNYAHDAALGISDLVYIQLSLATS